VGSYATTTAGTGLSYNGTSFLLNTANANTFSALQTFNYSSSTIYSSFVTSSSTFANVGSLTVATSSAGCAAFMSNGLLVSTGVGCGGAGTNPSIGGTLTSATAGSVLFAGSGTFAQDNANFFFDNTAKRLGLATTTPFAKLSVNSIGGEPAFVVGSSTATSLIVDKNGNVGVGNASPSKLLSVGNANQFTVDSSGNIIGATVAGVITDVSTSNAGSKFGVGGANPAGSIIGVQGESYLNGPMVGISDNGAGIGGNGQLLNVTGYNAPLFVVMAKGNVGIGTSTPYSLLNIASSTKPQLALEGADTDPIYTFRSIGGSLYISTSSPTTFATSSISALEISATGTTTLRGLNISALATSTSNVGFSITSGCYAIGTTCLSAGGGSSQWSNITGGINYTGGNVGVGTSTPFGELSVSSNGSQPAFVVGSSQYTSLIVDKNGNVGIGTAKPSATFQITDGTYNFKMAYATGFQNETTGSNSWANFGTDGSANILSWFNSSNAIQGSISQSGGLAIGNTYASTDPGAGNMIISGNIGIGTTNPLSPLSVGAGSLSDPNVYVDINAASGAQSWYGANKGGAYGLLIGYSNGEYGTTAAQIRQVTTDPLQFLVNSNTIAETMIANGSVGIGSTTPFALLGVNAPAGQASFVIGSSTATSFIVDKNGNVGIGTASPVTKFDMTDGTSKAQIGAVAAGYAGLSFNGSLSATNYNFLGGVSDNNIYFNRPSGASIQFRENNNGASQMTIASGGNVGIGTLSPSNLLNVQTNINGSSGITVQNVNSGSNNQTTIAAVNDTNAYMDMIVGGSGRSPVTAGPVANSGMLYASNSLLLITDGNVATGGTDPISFVTGGYNSIGSLVISAGSPGNVGVGTSTPYGSLAVNNIAGQPAFVVGSSTGTSFIVDQNGNVGVGTASPSVPLTLQTNSSGAGFAVLDSNGTDSLFRVNRTGGQGSVAGTINLSNNNIQIPFDAAANLAFNVSGNLTLNPQNGGNTIISNGNALSRVGIATGTPFALLGVNAPAGEPSFAIGSSTGTLFIVDKFGNVGIGATTTTAILSVKGNTSNASGQIFDVSSSTGASYFHINYAGNTGIGTTTPFGSLAVNNIAGQPALTVGSSTGTSFVVDKNGNVGVGTSSPTATLTVQGPAGSANPFLITSSNGAPLFSIDTNGIVTFANTGNSSAFTNGLLQIVNDTSGSLKPGIMSTGNGTSFATYGNGGGPLGQNGASTYQKAARIDNLSVGYGAVTGGDTNWGNVSGEAIFAANVGIGTTTPYLKLNIASTNQPQLALEGNNTDPIFTFRSIGGALYISTSSPTTFATSSLTAFTLNGNGNVGIGTSTPYGQLSVNSVGGLPAFVIGSSSATSFIIDQMGNVGLGTTTPSALLTVTGPSISQSGIAGTFGTTRGTYIAPPQTPLGQAVALKAVDYRAFEVAPYLYTLASSTKSQNIFGSVFNAYTVGTTTNNVNATTSSLIYISGAPIASSTGATSFTLSTSTALLIDGGSVVTSSGVVTKAYGLQVFAPIGATKNYAASFMNGNVGIGTSTPYTLLTISSTTMPQLALEGADTDAIYTFRSIGGSFYISTSSPLTFATSTLPAFSILSTGNIGIATSTPFGTLAVNAFAGNPSFSIGSSTGTSFIVDKNGIVGIGTSTPASFGNVKFAITGDAYFNSTNLTFGSSTSLKGATTTLTFLATTTLLVSNNNSSAFSIATSTIRGSGNGNAGAVFNIASVGATTTIGFFNSTTTGLYAGQGIALSKQNLMIVGDGSATTSLNVVNGSICADSDGWCSAATTTRGVITGVQLGTGGSDVAEMYNSNDSLVPGDIVTTDVHGMVKRAQSGDVPIGVVSTMPGLTLGSGPDYNGGGYAIALAGRVPVKVMGDIKVGDAIALDSDGIGRKAYPGDMVIAIALDDSQAGVVLGFINKTNQGVSISGVDMNVVGTTTVGLDTINGLRPVTYTYANSSTTQYGFVPEEVSALDPHLVTVDGNGKITGVNYNGLTAVLASSVQQIDVKVNAIDQRLMHLEAIIGSTTPEVATPINGISLDGILVGLQNVGVTIVQDIAYMKNVFVDSLTVGSKAKPSGITLYDDVTGDPYCLKMHNGAMVSLAGACDNQPAATTAPVLTGTSTPITGTSTQAVDTTAPVISVIGNNPATIAVGASYVDLGATVTDTDATGAVNNNLDIHYSVDGVSMSDINIDTSASTSTPSVAACTTGVMASSTCTHTIIFSAVDQSGNWGYATRTVNVIPVQ
jgi:hypothetical protein